MLLVRGVPDGVDVPAVGSLSTGLTHELNNAAAAAVRVNGALRERAGKM